MLSTRFDIAYPVGILYKFSSAPTNGHWASSKRLLRYLRTKKETQFVFRSSNNIDLVAYPDAYWASSHDRKSTTWFLIYVARNLVAWSKQRLRLLRKMNWLQQRKPCEIMWIHELLSSMGVEVDIPVLYFDSQLAISVAHTSGYHVRRRHLDFKHKLLSECMWIGREKMTYKATEDMLWCSEPGTTTNSFQEACILMGLSDEHWVRVLWYCNVRTHIVY